MGSELESLALQAARSVAGADAIKQVKIRSGEDSSERPVYYFSFLVDQQRSRQRAGLVRTRLIQHLRDALVQRGDGHLPVIEILDQIDWDKRARA